MIERQGDLWEIAEAERAVVVITTNGSIRKDGCAVMGRGCALEAKLRFPGIDKKLAESLRRIGNYVAVLRDAQRDGDTLLSFPVKHKWNEVASPDLIVRSALELVNICNTFRGTSNAGRVVMPRPGCGNGRLRWEDVRPLLAQILDDRFIVVHKEE